jgi:hypothetical protein
MGILDRMSAGPRYVRGQRLHFALQRLAALDSAFQHANEDGKHSIGRPNSVFGIVLDGDDRQLDPRLARCRLEDGYGRVGDTPRQALDLQDIAENGIG